VGDVIPSTFVPRLGDRVSEEFHKLGPNSAASVKGFRVALDLLGGVRYSDAIGTVKVDSELLDTPPSYSIALYQNCVGLDDMPTSRAEEILGNMARALEYLGYKVMVSGGSTWDTGA
jgi:hypothetical protein